MYSPRRVSWFRYRAVSVLLLGMFAALIVVNLNCSDDSTTPSPSNEFAALAGGGRAVDSDPFVGPDGSGPNEDVPGTPDIEPGNGPWPIAFLDPACGEAPAIVVIEDSTAWRVWWEANTACLEYFPDGTRPGMRAGGLCHGPIRRGDGPSDSVVVDPDSTDPGYGGPPFVDFDTDVVIAVTLERVENDPRWLTIDEVLTSPEGTVVRYTVYHPGDDCFFDRDSLNSYVSAPAVAILQARPFNAPLTEDRRDSTYSCSWEPDPDRPLALYYTDAPCDLGGSELILTTPEDWDAWVAQTLACDFERWDCLIDSTIVPSDSTDWGHPGGWVPGGWPGDPDGRTDPVVPAGYTIPVDFSQFAVIILRAGDQDRWGGGIWLTDLRSSASGTAIEYTVITPGADCPAIWNPCDLGEYVNPTVAIRVPLPLPEPVQWTRLVEAVECDWGWDGDSTIVPEPR